MVRIINITAELCSIIIRSCADDSLYVKYSCISPEMKKKLISDIYDNVPQLFSVSPDVNGNDICIRQLYREDIDDKLCSALERYISLLSGRSEQFAMITLANVLDEAMEELLKAKISEYQTDSFSVVLNTNRETTGIGLLPRCHCIWERKHRLSQSCNRLDDYLYNFLLIENSILGELIDKHIFLPKEFFPDLNIRKCINVCASPLRMSRDFKEIFYEKDSVQYFSIDCNTDDPVKENEAVWKRIIRSAESQCDIIVFPEMLGNNETEEYIISKLKELTRDEQERIPSMIVLPSVWKNSMNTAAVLDRWGNVVCRQSKQNPFRSEFCGSGYLEGIRTNNVVSILHYEGIGRIAILICKDFLNTKYMEQIMRCFRLTLIIVPSFSTGSYDFCRSFDLCAHDDCNVIWINTCAAMQKGKEANFKNIGYVRKRIGRNDDDSQKLCEMPICEGAFNGICSQDCLYTETIYGV